MTDGMKKIKVKREDWEDRGQYGGRLPNQLCEYPAVESMIMMMIQSFENSNGKNPLTFHMDQSLTRRADSEKKNTQLLIYC